MVNFTLIIIINLMTIIYFSLLQFISMCPNCGLIYTNTNPNPNLLMLTSTWSAHDTADRVVLIVFVTDTLWATLCCF